MDRLSVVLAAMASVDGGAPWVIDRVCVAAVSVQAGASPDTVHQLLAGEPPHWAEVHQATGMVSAQMDVSIDEAFVRLRAHAFADRRSLHDVARDVIARRVRFERASDR